MNSESATGTSNVQRSTPLKDKLLNWFSGSQEARLFTRRSIPIGLFVLSLHLFLLVNALVNKSYLTDDSIQYLTLSENLIEHGTFSQSYIPPFVPDLQRTPGYPAFLVICGNSIPFVLILQHLMVLLSGLVLFRMMGLFFKLRVARAGAWIWLLQPYPILMASMVLSEVPFILFFLIGFFGVLKYLKEGGISSLTIGLIGLVVAIYIRPVALPVLLLLLVVVIVRIVRSWKSNNSIHRIYPLLITLLLVPLLLGPWIMRNHNISGRWMVSSMGDMAMLHGRLGGLEAYRQGLGVGETGLFRLGDSLALKGMSESGEVHQGLQGYREYYSQKQSHETELYRSGGCSSTIQYYLNHPIDGILFQGKSFLNMLKGVGFGWSEQVTGSRLAAYTLSGLQLVLNLLMYLGCLWALWRIRRWPKGFWIVVVGTGLVLLVSNAAWADGRYRMVIDPLLVFMSGIAGSLWNKHSQKDIDQHQDFRQ